MGEVITAGGPPSAARGRSTSAGMPSRAEFFFDLASSVHVPGGRAGRPRLRRGDVDAGVPRTLRCGALRSTGDAPGAADAPGGRGARRRAAPAARSGPSACRRRCRPRCASPHYAAQQGRGAAFVLAATRLAFCGGFDLDDLEILAEAAAAAGLGSTAACARRATSAATARSRRPAAACSARARTGCRRCGRPRAVLGRGARRRRRRDGAHARAAAAASAGLRGDEPREDLRVDATRVAPRVGARRRGQDRVLAVGLGEQQLEVGVGDVVVGSGMGAVLMLARPMTLDAPRRRQRPMGGATPRAGGIDSRAMTTERSPRACTAAA